MPRPPADAHSRMFNLKKNLFGDFETFHLEHSESGMSMTIIPEAGGIIHDLSLKHNDKLYQLIDSYSNVDELVNVSGHKSSHLLPFPNRLKNGKYTFNDITYQFPKNHGENNLHGFLSFIKMNVSNVELEHSSCRITLDYEYKGNLDFYPFPFLFTVNYSLNKDRSAFEMAFSIKNIGKTSLPIGYGWHPYFKLNGKVNDWNLQLPPSSKVEVDQQLIPNGNLTPFNDFKESRPIQTANFDTCFKIDPVAEITHFTLSSEEISVKFWQASSNHHFPYYQIYTPPSRASIAIEPMTCNVNAFATKDGLTTLQPDETLSGKFGLHIV